MASKTIELHDVNVPEFLKELDSCKGNVYLVTREGDRLNLRSKLCQLVGLTQLIEGGKINTRPMLTHRMPLNDIMKGYEIFEKHLDGCVKVAITPYER